MYISVPSIFIPELSSDENKMEIMSIYKNIYNKYIVENDKPDKMVYIPRANIESEELISKAIKPISENLCNLPVNYLVDCRSSASANVPAPSYKVLALNSLVNAIPFCIQHLGGAEFFSGLSIIKPLLNDNSHAVVTTVQRFHNINDRVKDLGYIRGDASSAMIVNKNMDKSYKQYQIINIESFQKIEINSEFRFMLSEFLLKNNLAFENLDWCIVNNYSVNNNKTLKKNINELNILYRSEFKEVDFGTSDIPVSLHYLQNQIPFNSIGLFLHLSSFKNINIALVKSI